MTEHFIKTATEADEQRVINALKLAFELIPLHVGFGQSRDKYLLHFPIFVKAFGGKAFAHKTAHYVGNYYGAALWLPPNVHPDVDALIELLQSSGSRMQKEMVQKYLRKPVNFIQMSHIGIYHY